MTLFDTAPPTQRHRYWKCDRGHRNEIADNASRIFYAHCTACPVGDVPYRVERDVPATEVDP